MQTLPLYIYIVFGLTTVTTITFFFFAAGKSLKPVAIIGGWLLLQTIICAMGFYKNSHTVPPRLGLLIFPPIIMTAMFFLTTRGKAFIDSLDMRILTLLHIVRIPVEIVLFWLFTYQVMPQIVTFEGRNFDILSGISAPFIYYFGFVKGKLSKNVILTWNFICLGLLLNVVTNALLSAPTVLQQFAFDRPSVAIMHFPFIFLPGCIVPLVLFSHLVAIRRLLSK